MVEGRNVDFSEPPPNLLFAPRQLSPQQDLESPSYDFSDDTLDDTLDNNYVSHDDILVDVQNYISALTFGVDTPAGTVELLLLSKQTSPGVTLPGGASFARTLSEGVTPEESSLPPAPTPASAAPRETNGHANHGPVVISPAVTRTRAASLLPVPVATRYGVAATATGQLWGSFLRWAHYSV